MNISELPHLTREQVPELLAKQGFAIGIMNPTEYHEVKKDFPLSLSKSTLFKAATSLLHYHTQQPVKMTDAIEKGLLIDMLALTPELFAEEYLAFDVKIDGRTKEGKAQAAQAKAEGRKPFFRDHNQDEVTAAERVQEVLASELQGKYETQVTMWVRVVVDEVAIILSGMIDILPHSPKTETIWDLKSTSVNLDNTEQLCKNMYDFGYGVQAAMYIDLFRACGGETLDAFTFLFVESSAPSRTRIVRMEAVDIARYRELYSIMLADVAKGHKTGDWGSPHLDECFYTPPYWEEKDLTRKGFEV